MVEAAGKQQEIVGLWPIPDMAQGMRVEHDRLAQLGWIYDGFGGYRKRAASSHPGPKLDAQAAKNLIRGRRRSRGREQGAQFVMDLDFFPAGTSATVVS